MALQTQVRQFQTSGLPGEIANAGPIFSTVWIVRTSVVDTFNMIGYAYTQLEDGVATPGGNGATEPFLGILVRPKEEALLGDDTGTLQPVYYLSDNQNGTLLTTGEIWVNLGTAGSVGDSLAYVITTGQIGSASVWTVDDITYSAVPSAKIITEDIPAAGLAKIRIID